MIRSAGRKSSRFRTCGYPGCPLQFALFAGHHDPAKAVNQESNLCKSSPAIFKAYDIRGIVPSTINADVARGLGRALARNPAMAEGRTTVAVGATGAEWPWLAGALMDGLREASVTVIDIGMVATPMLYFAANTLCASGIQVTGSHNPKDYNGFKMVLGGAPSTATKSRPCAAPLELRAGHLRPGGSRQSADVLPAYRGAHRGRHQAGPPGEGWWTAATALPVRRPGHPARHWLRGDRTVLEVDGNFPNHHPDPSKPGNLRT